MGVWGGTSSRNLHSMGGVSSATPTIHLGLQLAGILCITQLLKGGSGSLYGVQNTPISSWGNSR